MKKIFISTFLSLFALIGYGQTTDAFTTSGTWTCPAGVTSVSVECWGGGGAGGGSRSTVNSAGGGGGGGGYSANGAVTVVPGNTYNIVVGTGGIGVSNAAGGDGSASSFNATTVVANGGAGGGRGNSGAGGNGAGLGTGTIRYTGGNGAAGVSGTASGGGGGAAGSTGNGGAAAGQTAGIGATLNGGSGGAGRSAENAGRDGLIYGGGGSGGYGGAGGTALAGGNGANGYVTITYNNCTSPTTQATINAYTNNTTGNTLTVNWTRGNGTAGVIVVARLTATAAVTPSSGTSYAANPVFGSGAITGAGNFVVYNGTGTTVNISGLVASTSYTFTVYEYNTLNTCYKTPGSSSAVTTASAASPCASTIVMTCGTTYSNTLLPTGSDWTTYTGCSYSEPGDEQVYSFTPATTCDYTFTTTTTTGDPDFFLMSTCGTSGTNVYGSCWSSGNITVALTAGVTYYLIVDNYSSSGNAAYSLSVSCPCSATPNAGTAAATLTTVSCANPSTNLSATGLSSGCGISYQWQSSPTGGAPWTNIVGATNATYTASPISNLYYRIVTLCAISGLSNNSSSILISSSITPPTNDECVNAINVTVNADDLCGSVTAGSTVCATNSGIATCVGTDDDDVWFKFTATNTSHIFSLLNITGSSTDLAFEVFSGNCGSLNSVACSDPESATYSGFTVGAVYYVRVYTYYASDDANFNLCIGTPPPPPSNDDPCGAIPLAVNAGGCSYQSAVLNMSTTATAGVPAPGCASLGPDIWFTAVVPASGRLIVELGNSGGPTDMDMAWYTATGCSGTFTLIECDDADSQDGAMAMICRTGVLCTVPGDCQQNATLTPGQTIYIRVWEYGGGTSGPFDICAYEPAAPGAASTCATATTIAALPFTQTNNTTCCRANSVTSAQGCGSTYQDGEDFLYKYTPAANQTIDITLTGTLSYTGIFVTNACPGNAGNCVASATSFSGNPLLCGVNLVAGTTYYIMIDTDPTPNCTPFNISISSSSTPSCGLNYTAAAIGFGPDLNAGTNIALPVDDRFSSSYIPIGFPFCFDGFQHTQLLVSSNGYVIFDPIGCASNLPSANAAPGGSSGWDITANVPNNTNAPRNCIMFPFQDIYPSLGGTIKYQTLGTAPNRRFVLTFDNIPYFDCETIYFTGQLKLFETTNNIEMHITQKVNCATWNESGAIMGLHNYNGTISVVPAGYNYSTPWTSTNQAWRFTCNCATCTVLPVELIEFTGEKVSSNVNLLTWKTATETNNAFFEVQRMNDNGEFVVLDKVTGAGNSNSEIKYTYSDNDAPANATYYRLRQVDNDGQYTYSSTIVVGDIADLAEINAAYPNPANDILTIKLNSDGTNMRVVLVAADGREIVLRENVSVTGYGEMSFDVSSVQAGVYFLKISSPKNEVYFKDKIVIE